MSNIVKKEENTLKSYLMKPEVRSSIAAVLPRHMDADRMVRIVLQAANRTPDLLKCTPQSVALALVNAAQLGLEAGSLTGSAYLVPFNNKKTGNKECQLIPGYRGLIDLARRSGEVLKIEARVIYEGDDFDIDYGAGTVRHRPSMTSRARVDILGAYAIATLKNAITQIEFMTREEIDGIRKRSRAGDSGPWVTDFSEMCRKTVVRRLIKYLPLSPELSRAEEIENAVEEELPIRDVTEGIALPDDDTPIRTGSAGLKNKLAKRLAKGVEPVADTPPEADTPEESAEETAPAGEEGEEPGDEEFDG